MSRDRKPRLVGDNVQQHVATIILTTTANVDEKKTLVEITEGLNQISLETPVIFPVHPRTTERLKAFDIKFNSNKKITPVQK